MTATSTLRQEIKEELTYLPIMKTGDYERISNNIIKLIEKRIDSLDTEYKLKVKGTKYQTGYYNALLDVKEMLK